MTNTHYVDVFSDIRNGFLHRPLQINRKSSLIISPHPNKQTFSVIIFLLIFLNIYLSCYYCIIIIMYVHNDFVFLWPKPHDIIYV